MPADNNRSRKGLRRGFVIGELLVALLLLAVAVSSLAALMYSVTRRPSTGDKTVCVGRKGAAGGCASLNTGEAGASKLLRSGCATRVGFAVGCKDTVVSREGSGESSDETILRARTDSAAMALLAKRAKPPAERPDRGFIR